MLVLEKVTRWSDRSRSRRIIDEIRQILLNMWDPIGVADMPECADEYDCRIGGVYSLRQAKDHMGLGVTKDSTIATVIALRRVSMKAADV